MKHLGNITSIDPVRAGIVDCVIGGSPCQDLSIAGKRAGLGGERSGLFMEQIRICKEMREADKANGKTGVDVRPRFCVWENVPGALSSNGGEDFRIVLEEFCKVEDEGASVPRPEWGWSTAGCIVGDGYSVAWRVMDARYWGVPQRRRRIALVADFGGHCAPEILFDEQGMRWDSAASGKAWESIAGHAAGSVGGSCEVQRLSPLDQKSKRLFGTVAKCGCFMGGQGSKAGGIGYSEKESPTLKSAMSGGNTVPTVCYDARGNGDGETVCTITGDHCNRITDYTPLVLATGQGGAEIGENQSPCLNCNHEQPIVVAIDCINLKQIENESGTLCAKKTGYSLNYQNPICYPAREPHKYVARRLTPLECSRLQGLPDDWCNVPGQEEVTEEDLAFWRDVWKAWAEINGKQPKTDKQIEKWLKEPISESHQYQIYGNGIALPQWVYVLGRICEALGKDEPTMASLFDGSGSFPLIWEHINGKGTAVWSSEVNPEAVRVSRYRIG